MLTEAGDLAAAERVCAAALARARDAGDLWNQAGLLCDDGDPGPAGGPRPRTPRRTCGKRSSSPRGPAAGMARSTGLDCCGYLCAATGRPAEAVTVWAARAAL